MMNDVKYYKIELPRDFLRVMNKMNKGNNHIIQDIFVYLQRRICEFYVDFEYEVVLYMNNPYLMDMFNISYDERYYCDLFIKTSKIFNMEDYKTIKINFI